MSRSEQGRWYMNCWTWQDMVVALIAGWHMPMVIRELRKLWRAESEEPTR